MYKRFSILPGEDRQSLTRKKGDQRHLPVGAEVLPSGGVSFKVWAPNHRRLQVAVEGGAEVDLKPEGQGYFSGKVSSAAAGDLYRYRLDDKGDLYPDPASRFQPAGPHGPSQIVDPGEFAWTDKDWKGHRIDGMVLYEMHIGTFTQEGTWDAAQIELQEIASIGVNALEIMPIAEFPGAFGWGYDGVYLFAPYHHYGSPRDLRNFVDEAHASGIAVILDVVYNHLGPDGNYLTKYSEDYFTDRYWTEWGRPFNLDGENSGPVREFILANASYWIDEYHMDGLRLDATQNIYDSSPDHIFSGIGGAVRAVAGGRATVVIGENESQDTRLVRPESQGGCGLNALWNDDFHHSAMAGLTGHNEAYYTDYLGSPQEFISAVKWGYLYQGQRYKWQKKRRGSPSLDLRPWTFVIFLQNHDQLANSGRGSRVHQLTSPGKYKAMTALMLLAPNTPMLFQGQEFASSKPFYYFADHVPKLAGDVHQGRREFLRQFRSLATPEAQEDVPDPRDRMLFERSKLDFSERWTHQSIYDLHKDLLRLRCEDPVFRSQGRVEGAVLSSEAFLLRFFGQGTDRLLLVNLGLDLHLDPAPEPLLAPPLHEVWSILLSSEDVKYGGMGTPPLDTEENWRIPGHAAVAMASGASKEVADWVI